MTGTGPLRAAPMPTVDHAAYYIRTAHCGGCGQPGDYCLCITKCGCAGLHTFRSGFEPGAVDRFADTPPADDQEALF